MNKILVKLYIPMISREYDIWVPTNRRVHNVIRLIVKALNELTDGEYCPKMVPLLYDKKTSCVYDINQTVRELEIKNGSEMVLL